MVTGIRKTSIKDFENYSINEKGEVYLLRYYYPEYDFQPKLAQRIDRAGYLTVRLSKDGKTYTKYLHRLIAEHFVPNPSELLETNHLDGNVLNNSPANLEWVSHKDNVIHAYKTGLNSAAKQVWDIFSGKKYHSISEACRATGLNFNTASKHIKSKPNYRLKYVG